MSRLFRRKAEGIVNVKMVITEEKILSNIDKIQKLINPKSKKQIVKLEEDSYFKDLVESVKSYLLEYPKKNSFPRSVYSAAYGLVEFATNQFEENTKTVEELIRKREKNIKLASVLRDATKVVKAKAKNWKVIVKKLEPKYSPDVAKNLNIIGNSTDTGSQEYIKACKYIDVKISNLEANLHIEIDMERIEDASKALSYIGIEIAEALKYIPTPVEDSEDDELNIESQTKAVNNKKNVKNVKNVQNQQKNSDDENNQPKIGGGSEKTNIRDIDEELEDETEEAEDYETEEDYEDYEEEEAYEEEDTYEEAESQDNVANAQEEDFDDEEYLEETRFEKKPSLWQRIKNSKLVRTINYILKIRVVLDYPALPDGNSNK